MIERKICPVCGEHVAQALFEVPYLHPSLEAYYRAIGFQLPRDWFQDRLFSLRSCPRCTLLFQTWILTPEQTEQLYGTNEAPHRPIDTPLLPLTHLAQDVLIARQCLSMNAPKVLDFGMGWGRFALLAQAYGCDVSGVEVSETTQAHARAHGIRLVEEATLEPDFYDMVMVDQVLEHLPEPLAIAQKLQRCLKPGGIMLWGVPSRPRLPKLLKKALSARDPVAVLSKQDLDAVSPTIHLNLFNTQSLRQLGFRAGLELFNPSPLMTLGAGALWQKPRQWNRHFLLAWKYWRGVGGRIWFRKPKGSSGSR